MNNVSFSCITAAAGTGINQNLFLLNKNIVFFNQKNFTAYPYIIH